jgi:hypothetical protein
MNDGCGLAHVKQRKFCPAWMGPGSDSGVRCHEKNAIMKFNRCRYTVVHMVAKGQHGLLAIVLVLEGNRDMVTIPSKKMEVYPEMSKKFCGATPMYNSTIVSLSSC